MKTILVVDDDAVFRTLAAHALVARGHVVLQAKSGRDAERVLAAETPDLLLVDGLLPDTDGMKWITRQREGGMRVPVIFVSAFWKSSRDSRQVTACPGIEAFLAKPVLPAVLIAQVERTLGLQAEAATPAALAPPQQPEPGLTRPA